VRNGHPKGLATLFFTEMWERLGFYIMVGILALYITDNERGGLGLPQDRAGEIYGTYMAFVYFTPFLGGMIADRFFGFRRSVFLGGVLMAAGYFLLAWRSFPTFFAGLVLLCVGNGFFKPNISAMVGNLYEPGDPKRDAGFNIFYMGINIGATLSAIVAAPLRNVWNFNYAFAAAGVGLVISTIWLVMNWKKLAAADRRSEPNPEEMGFGQICLMIVLPAAIFGVLGYFVGKEIPLVVDTIEPVTFGFIVGMLPVIGYFVLLVKRAAPEEKPGLAALMPVFLAGGTFFMILHLSAGAITFFAEGRTKREAEWIPDALWVYKQKAMPSYFENADSSVPRPDERMLIQVDEETATLFGQKRMSASVLAAFQKAHPEVRLLDSEENKDKIRQDEQDLVCRIFKDEYVKIKKEKGDHGRESVSVKIEPETAAPLRKALFVKDIDAKESPVILVTEETFKTVYAGASEARSPPGKFLGLVNAEMITALLNPVFVVAFTPLLVLFFAWRLRRKRGITTARKIFYGLVFLTISLAFMAWAAYVGDNGSAKVSMMWLVAYYVIITVGELCLSPMGLSLVTKLSPARLVGLMMGGWFLSTAIGNKLSGFISGLPPDYGVFIVLTIVTALVAALLFMLLPWMDRVIKKYGA